PGLSDGHCPLAGVVSAATFSVAISLSCVVVHAKRTAPTASSASVRTGAAYHVLRSAQTESELARVGQRLQTAGAPVHSTDRSQSSFASAGSSARGFGFFGLH